MKVSSRVEHLWQAVLAYLLAPPASGETIVQFFHSGMFSFIHLSTAGSAYKLSTGISKNPWRKIINIKLSWVTGDKHILQTGKTFIGRLVYFVLLTSI